MGGGAGKGSFEVGVLKYLYEEIGLRPDIICGTSVGALNAIVLAQGGDTFPQLERLWRGIGGNWDVVGPNPEIEVAIERMETRAPGIILRFLLEFLPQGQLLKRIFEPRGLWGDDLEESASEVFGNIDCMYVTDPLRELVTRNIDVNSVASSGILLRMSVVDLVSGAMYYVDQQGRAHPGRGNEPIIRSFDDIAQSLSEDQPGMLGARLFATRSRRSALATAGVSGALPAPENSEEIGSVRRRLQRASRDMTNSFDVGVIDGVMASAAVPGAFCPVIVDDHVLVDGGVREMVPLDAAIELGADELYVILASSESLPGYPAGRIDDGFPIVNIILRSADILLKEIAENDLRRRDDPNLQIEVISPSWNIQESLDFGRHIIALNIWYGFETARSHFEGSSAPSYMCMHVLKLLANKLDQIDTVERMRRAALERARDYQERADEDQERADNEMGSMSDTYRGIAESSQRRADSASRLANEYLPRWIDRLRREADSFQATLEEIGCPLVPGVSVMEIPPDILRPLGP